MKLPILKEGDEKLRVICKPVGKVTQRIKKLAADMIETMYANRGVGLAGPQVGSDLRIIVFDPRTSRRRNPTVLINPVLTELEGEIKGDEGCLSCPGLWAEVKRFAHVKATGLNENGEEVEIVSEGGVLSVVLQHETDHLDGILFLDRLDPSQQLRVQSEREELKK